MEIKTFLSIVFILLMAFSLHAEEKKKVIYKYKKRETIDLGSLEIQGQIIAPGDLSIEKRSRKVFKRDLLTRPHFIRARKEGLNNIR